MSDAMVQCVRSNQCLAKYTFKKVFKIEILYKFDCWIFLNFYKKLKIQHIYEIFYNKKKIKYTFISTKNILENT